ncbi:MAG: pyrroline-5-carboxylate reductase [Candidatus Saganbacteria bacterium]|nr:pyrroline-5-carboxylate reductase [Candidatus Saganbacteria bacterium]
MVNLQNSKIAFIGAGKMAEALIHGLCQKKILPPSHIIVSDKKASRIKHLSSCYHVRSVFENSGAVASANIIILAVKPQDMAAVLLEIAPYVTKSQLVISIAAGITLESMEKILKKIPVMRTMPNNAAMVLAAITALSPGTFVNETQLKFTEIIFNTVGETLFVPEKFLDGVTALSGSGPAFVFLFLEGLLAGAKHSKLPALTARRLALGMIEGAVKTVRETEKPLRLLGKMVASKGGTTEAGLRVLKKYKFKKAVEETILAAAKRSKQLSQ